MVACSALGILSTVCPSASETASKYCWRPCSFFVSHFTGISGRFLYHANLYGLVENLLDGSGNFGVFSTEDMLALGTLSVREVTVNHGSRFCSRPDFPGVVKCVYPVPYKNKTL